MQDELFTTTELTSFGNYLLSRGRSLSILDSESDIDATTLLSQVHHADFENWKAKHGEAGVAIVPPEVAIVEKIKFCSLCEEAWGDTDERFDKAEENPRKALNWAEYQQAADSLLAAMGQVPSAQQDTQARLTLQRMLEEIVKMAGTPGSEERGIQNSGTPREVRLVDTPLVL